MTLPHQSRAPRFGVVGSGRMAAVMMATLRAAGAEVRAIASRDQARARHFADAFGVVAAHGHWAELVRRPDIDAVYVANAAIDHAAVTIAALEAGKAVLCEKPLAPDPVAAAQVLNAARLSGKLCMEGLWTSFLPAHRRFQDLAQRGACGDPIHLQADFGYPEPPSSRLFRPEAGGVLLDRAIYLVALAIQTMGPVSGVRSVVDLGVDNVDRHALLALEHKTGRSQLTASFTALLSNSAVLSGSKGFLRIEEPLLGAENLAVRMAKARPGAGSPLRGGGVTGRLRRSPLLRRVKGALPVGVHERLSYGSDPYLPQVEHFLDLMRRGAPESDVVPLSLSLEVSRVIQRARSACVTPSLRALLS